MLKTSMDISFHGTVTMKGVAEFSPFLLGHVNMSCLHCKCKRNCLMIGYALVI